jgi:hypothetical protein
VKEFGSDPEWTYTFSNVVKDHNIQVFQYVVITALGDISPSGKVTALYGSNLTFTITNKQDTFCLLVDGKQAEAQLVKDDNGESLKYTFESVKADHTIQVSEQCYYTITATGNIEPHGRITVLYGSNPVFSIKDCTRKLLVDGESVDVADTYQFANVTENHMIEAYADLADGLLILRILAGADIEGLDPCLDFNGDGKIDMTDALYVFRQISDQ